jgi:hypothetical protein
MTRTRSKPVRPEDFVDNDPIDVFEIKPVPKAGMGLFARKSFATGDFLLNYRGIFRDDSSNEASEYTFGFVYQGINKCVDASAPNSGLARYINDVDWEKKPNCKCKLYKFNDASGEQQCCIEIRAVRNIEIGTSHLYT